MTFRSLPPTGPVSLVRRPKNLTNSSMNAVPQGRRQAPLCRLDRLRRLQPAVESGRCNRPE